MVVLSALGEIAFPLIQSHVATHAAPNRVRSFTLVFTVGPSVALGLGPLLSGALIALSGLRAAFVLAAVLTALSVLCFARLRGFDHDAGATPVAPASYRDALAETSIRRLLALQGATVFALALGTSFVPTFLEDVRGFSAATIAQMGAGAAVGSALFGLAVSRVGRLQRAPFVGAAIAVGALGVGFVIFLTTASTILLAVAWVCRGGLFAAWALFAAALGEAAAERHRARAFALCEMTGGTALSLAPMAAGPLYAARPALPMLTAAILAGLLVPVLLAVQRRAPPDMSEAVAAPLAGSPVDPLPPDDSAAASPGVPSTAGTL